MKRGLKRYYINRLAEDPDLFQYSLNGVLFRNQEELKKFVGIWMEDWKDPYRRK